MSQPYNSMSQMPSHGNASNARVANAREGFQQGMMRGGPRMGGGMPAAATCQFPQPPPARTYCHPAAFSSMNGMQYHRLLDAYGQSVPSMSYY